MMTQINPYLTFNGRCREAMSFYQTCLGGALALQAVKDSPMADQWPAEIQEGILHASLVNGGLVLLGSDMGAEGPSVPGNVITLSLTCSSEEEMKTFYSRLSDGGQATKPPHEFFAGMIGMLTDRYGMTWMLYYEKKPAAAN